MVVHTDPATMKLALENRHNLRMDPLTTTRRPRVAEDSPSSGSIVTTDTPQTQIPPPPVLVDFRPFSCNWFESFYICYAQGSNYCIIIRGPRPASDCISARPTIMFPRASDAQFFSERFCSRKSLLEFVATC